MKVKLWTFIIVTYIVFYLICLPLFKKLFERFDYDHFPFKDNRKKAIINLIWCSLVFSGFLYFAIYQGFSWHLPKIIEIEKNESVSEYILLSDNNADDMKATFGKFHIKNSSLKPIYVIRVDYSKKINQKGRLQTIKKITTNESFCVSEKPYSEMERVPDYISYKKSGKFNGCRLFIVSEKEYNKLLKRN